jgi:hypothetical protein
MPLFYSEDVTVIADAHTILSTLIIIGIDHLRTVTWPCL